MQYDYSKIVSFLYGKQIEKLNDVLRYILLNEFVMLDVNVNAKMILLEKKNIKYVLLKLSDRLLIVPDNYRSMCLYDEFGEIVEISFNDEGNIVVSKLFRGLDTNGVSAITSTWHYEDGLYNEVVGKVMFISQDKLENTLNDESLDMFLNKYHDLRNDILKDLFWDLTLYAKNNFIDVKISERIMISDGFNKDKFEVLYKKHYEKALEVIK